jgi:isoaspartyl peptidase/L-asparaginase-like protein (Ntn-hydrolase superfamily)
MNHEATLLAEPRGLTISQRIKDRTQKRKLETLPRKLIEGNSLGSPEEYVVFMHGGAGANDEEWYNLRKSGANRAAQLGEKLITSGFYSPGDVAVQMVADGEYDVNLIAGIGSDKNRRGKYQFDAFSMNPDTLGIATAIGRAKNPVYASRLIQYLPDADLITSEDATIFAKEQGLTFYTKSELNAGFKAGAESRYELYTPSDTIGAIVAAKWNGIWDIAIAGSTGGMRKKRGGRVGDCGVPAAGFYVDRFINEEYGVSYIAAALLSGVGEATMHKSPAGRWVQGAMGAGTNVYLGINTVRSILKTNIDGVQGWGALAGLTIYEARNNIKRGNIVILPTVPYFPYAAYSNLSNFYIEEVPQIDDDATRTATNMNGRRIKVGTSLSSI